MEALTIEHLTDIREAILRRLEGISEDRVQTVEARKEQARKVNSLRESLEQIEQRVKDLQFESQQLPFPS